MDSKIKTGLSTPEEEFLCPRLQGGLTPLFDLISPVSQLGEEVYFSCTAALAPKHKFAVTSSRTQSQIASAALKSSLARAGGSQVGTHGITMMGWSVVPDDVQWSGVLFP